MIGKSFTYNSVPIPYTTTEAKTEGWIADVVWKDILTRNSQIPRQDFHGVVSAPTFASGRLITISGQIFATDKATRGTNRKKVDDLFIIKSFPDTQDEFAQLTFTDDDGASWFINCKVYTMPTYTNGRCDPIIEFNTTLFADDPLIRGATLKDISGTFGLVSGISLPVNLPVAINTIVGGVSGSNDGNFASPAVVTINVPTPASFLSNSIDQSQLLSENNIAFGKVVQTSMAQQFLPEHNKLTGITVRRGNTAGTYTGLITVSIQGDNSGKPDGVPIGSTVLNATQWEAPGFDTDIDIPISADITADGVTKYWIVLDSSTADNSNFLRLRRSTSDSYSGGLFAREQNGNWNNKSSDAYFVTRYQDSIKNPRLLHVTRNTFYGYNGTIYEGDTLIIDTDNNTAELNGVNVLADRQSGSNWTFVQPGTNEFALTGDNYDVDNPSQATFKVEYRDTIL